MADIKQFDIAIFYRIIAKEIFPFVGVNMGGNELKNFLSKTKAAHNSYPPDTASKNVKFTTLSRKTSS